MFRQSGHRFADKNKRHTMTLEHVPIPMERDMLYLKFETAIAWAIASGSARNRHLPPNGFNPNARFENRFCRKLASRLLVGVVRLTKSKTLPSSKR